MTADQLKGYGYCRADQDGYEGEEVSPEEHNEEEILEASRQLLDAKEIEPRNAKPE